MKRAVIAASFFIVTTAFAQQPAGDSVNLREGLVIQRERGVAYVMTPGGGVASVDLATGKTTWKSPAAAKPLIVVGKQLVSQAESKEAADQHRLDLVGIEVENGAPTMRTAVELPPKVRVTIGESTQGRFVTSAQPSGDSAIVRWGFVPAPRSGMRSRKEPPHVDGAPPIVHSSGSLSGALRVNASTGEVTDAPVANAAPPPVTLLAPAERIVAAPPMQYASADGQYVLTSERVADDRVWDKYRWTIYDRATKQRAGEVRSHVAYAPFVIHGPVLVYETTPYTKAGQDAQPAKLHGVSLDTGDELWNVPVREVVYRGPMPP